MKKFVLILIILNFFSSTFAVASNYSYKKGNSYTKHLHSESSYNHAWCKLNSGIEDFENKDFTRVDCLTKTHAAELDFANKWAEGIGQALHYQKMTGKRAKVVLILENPTKEMVYFYRVKSLAAIHNFDVEYITPEILNIKNGKCPYIDCKCNRVKKNK